MKINLTLKTLGIALGVAVLLGMLAGSMLTWKCGKRETLSTIDTLMIREFKHDTTVCYDTIIISHRDTFYITPDTPIGDIPVVIKVVQDSLPLNFHGKRIWIPYDLGFHYRGILYSYHVETKPKPFEIIVKQPFVDLYGTAGLYVNYNLRPTAEVELGLSLWQKAVVFGRLTAGDDPIQVKPYIGVKWILF